MGLSLFTLVPGAALVVAAGVALIGAAAFLFAMAYDDTPIVATILAALLGLWSLRRMLRRRASSQRP